MHSRVATQLAADPPHGSENTLSTIPLAAHKNVEPASSKGSLKAGRFDRIKIK
jgi:hypothetical protein